MAEKKPVQQAVPTEAETDAHVDDLVNKALKALEEFEDFTQEQVDYIVAKCSVAGLDHHGILAEAAVNETGRGVFEDKAVKNLFACEYVTNNLRHLKTVGIINEDPLTGITEIAEPVGVVCGIVPTTNPTSTVIFKSLIALKTRNPIIFSFHPSAHESSKQAAIVIRDAAIAAGAPENCIQWLSIKSMYATNALMNHPGVATILATGGNAMVKAAYSCGKPALGVGAGNVPAYVEKTCVLPRAVNDIVLSKSFDNGMICASEQAAIVDQEIYSDFMKEIKRFHVYFVNKEEKAKLEKFMFGAEAYSDNVAQAKLNPNVVHPRQQEHQQYRSCCGADHARWYGRTESRMISSPTYGEKKGVRRDGLISRRFSVRYYGCSGTSTSTNQTPTGKQCICGLPVLW